MTQTCKRTVGTPRWVAVLVGVLALGSWAPGVHADVLVVDAVGGAGSDFTQLQAAIDAAVEGDVLLVRPGSYEAFEIDGKSLALVADPTATVLPSAPAASSIRNLATGQFVSLRGLTVEHGLALEDNVGAVWLEDCAVHGLDGQSFIDPSPRLGLQALNCDQVVLVRCEVRGGFPGSCSPCFVSGAGGANFVGSDVSVYDSSFTGTSGFVSDMSGGQGGYGVRVWGGRLVAEGSSITGADAVIFDCSPPPFCFFIQVGGESLLLAGGTPRATLYDTTTSTSPEVLSGTLVVEIEPSRSLALASPLREGQAAVLGFAGEPGDVVLVAVAIPPGWLAAPEFNGVWQVGEPFVLLNLGAVDGTGTLSLPFVVPDLLGLEALPAVV